MMTRDFNASRRKPDRRRTTIGASALVLAAILSSTAQAQTIDYGSLEQLFGEPVTTSATGTPQRVTEVPANMEIITAEEIRRSGAYDIPGVLRHVLGVDVLQWTNDNADVGIRGYNQVFSPRLLVLVNGRQVYADHYGYTPWSAIGVELDSIRQIEVVKGPNTALFGFNAVSGVVNIITYNPLYDTVNRASLRGGTQGMAQGSFIKTIRVGEKAALRLSADGRTDNDFTTPVPPSFGALARKQNDRFSLGLEGIVRLSDRVQLGLEVSSSGAATNDVNPVYALTNAWQSATSVKGQLTADTGIGLLQTTVYTNWTSQHENGNLPVSIMFDNRVTVAQVQDIFRLDADHTLRISVEYRHNENGTTPFAGGVVSYDVYSAGGMWNWTIAPALSLTNAVRLDAVDLGRTGVVPSSYPFTNADWDRSLNELSFNSGLVWKATDADTLRLLASRGVQLPSLSDLGAFVFVSPFLNVTGSPRLSPTIVRNYEIDWDHALPAIGGQFRAAAFHQQFENLVSVNGAFYPGSGLPPAVGHANVGDSSAVGIELSLQGTFLTDWRWGANYRYENVSDDFVADTKFLDFQNVTPKHVLKGNLGWTRGRWEADAYLYYQSATLGLESLPFAAGSFLSPIPAYVNADARIGYRITDWATFAVSGQNLLQSSQTQTSAPPVERRVFATLTVEF